MRLKVTGTTDATLTLNRNNRIVRGRETIIFEANEVEQQTELATLNRMGVLSVEEVAATVGVKSEPEFKKVAPASTEKDDTNKGKAVFVNENIQPERREMVHMTSDLVPEPPDMVEDNTKDITIPSTEVGSFRKESDASEQMGRQATIGVGNNSYKVTMKNSAIPGAESSRVRSPFIPVDGMEQENPEEDKDPRFIEI